MEMLLGAGFLLICIVFLMKPNKPNSQPKSETIEEMHGSASFQLFTVGRVMQELTDLLASQGLVNEQEADDYTGLLMQCVFKGPIAESKLTIEQVMSSIDAELIPVYEYAKQLRQQGTPHPESMALALKEWHKNHKANHIA